MDTPALCELHKHGYYPFPVPEAGKIQNLVCFFNERVDALYVDGELMPKPKTRWSQLSGLRASPA